MVVNKITTRRRISVFKKADFQILNMKGLLLSVFSAVFVVCLTTAAALPDDADLAKREYAPLAEVLRDLYANELSVDKRKGWGGCQDDMMDWISFQHCMRKRAAAIARFRRDLQNL